MRLRRSLLVAVVVGVVSFVAVPLGHAAFGGNATATATLTAGQLATPTGLTATTRCTFGLLGVVLSAHIDVAWTPSSTTWATGQVVGVTDGAGAPVGTPQTLGPTATSATFELPLISGGTYTAAVRTTYGGWTSVTASRTTSGC